MRNTATENISAKIPRELYELVTQVSKIEGLSKSSLYRQALKNQCEMYIRQHQTPAVV